MLNRNVANCPNCAGPVPFAAGSTMVAICEFCDSAIARTDRDFENLGKVAQIVQTTSLIQIGTTGRFRGKPFEVTGRVQYKHAAGGTWDEWYVQLPGEKVAWLAEAQGQYHLTFERTLPHPERMPGFDELRMGQPWRFSGTDLTVTEKGVATAASAEGQIPWAFRPGAEHRYIDLQGGPESAVGNKLAHGGGAEMTGHAAAFATIDYSSSPITAYVGRTVTVDELNLQGTTTVADEVITPAQSLNCPSCGGGIQLHTPDQTMRVGCPNCGAMIDTEQGRFRVLSKLKQRAVHPVIPLGSTGKLYGKQYVVIGFMQRYAKYQGQTFPWDEYLLYNPAVGYRWLVDNNRHWSFVEPIPPVQATSWHHGVSHDGIRFKLYDKGYAYVRHVVGEFYWRVSTSDVTQTEDYIAPPLMVSVERSGSGEQAEINTSLARYVPVETLREAFNVKSVPRPFGVGIIQPPVALDWRIFGMFIVMAGYCTMMFFANADFVRAGQADPMYLMLAYVLLAIIPGGILAYRYSVEVTRWRESDYSPYRTE